MLELLDILILCLKQRGEPALPGGQRQRFFRKVRDILQQLLIRPGAGLGGGIPLSADTADGGFELGKRCGIGILLVHRHEIGGVGIKRQGIFRLKHAAGAADLRQTIEGLTLAHNVDQSHFRNSQPASLPFHAHQNQHGLNFFGRQPVADALDDVDQIVELGFHKRHIG